MRVLGTRRSGAVLGGIPDRVRERPLAAFSVLALAATWILVSPLVLSALGVLPVRVPRDWHALGAAGPVLAAFVVAATVGGKAGVRGLLGRMGPWRVGASWALFGTLSPLLLFALSAVILRFSGGPWPDWEALTGYADLAWMAGLLLSSVAYGLGEEPGWREFALPELQRGRSALFATLILTAVWALWHAPFFLYRYEFGPGQVVGFFLGLFAGAIWLTCLYNATGGSVLMVDVWHTVWNVVNQVAMVVSVGVLSLMSVLVMVGAVAIVVAWTPASLAPAGKAPSTLEGPSALSSLDHRLGTDCPKTRRSPPPSTRPTG